MFVIIRFFYIESNSSWQYRPVKQGVALFLKKFLLGLSLTHPYLFSVWDSGSSQYAPSRQTLLGLARG
jgi:hypothetical protein